MAQEVIDRIIENATEEQLRDIVRKWMRSDNDFKTFVEHTLNPPIDEIDFDAELGRALMHEARQCVSHRSDDTLDWGNIYYYNIAPWAKEAESLSTSSLWNLIVAIITRVAIAIDDDDFNGDDWYGNDHSQDISNILDALGNLCGLLVIDLTYPKKDWPNWKRLSVRRRLRIKSEIIWTHRMTPYGNLSVFVARLRRSVADCMT